VAGRPGEEGYAVDQVKVLLGRPGRIAARRRSGSLAGMRRWIEAILTGLYGA
jgi:hypothetical protein